MCVLFNTDGVLCVVLCVVCCVCVCVFCYVPLMVCVGAVLSHVCFYDDDFLPLALLSTARSQKCSWQIAEINIRKCNHLVTIK